MANKTSNPLDQLDPSKQQSTAEQYIRYDELKEQVKALQEHIDSLQGQVLQLQKCIPDHMHTLSQVAGDTFDDKVWQAIIIGGVTAMLHPSRVLSDTDKAMQQQITRILRMADSGLEAAKKYKDNLRVIADNQAKEKLNDPLKNLIEQP